MENLRTRITKPNNIKTLMIISGVLLVMSLIGVSMTVTQPAQVKQETALISYRQDSQFDYIVYLKPSYLYGPVPETPVPTMRYPQAVIDDIDFTYNFKPVAEVAGSTWIEAVLENPGIWQKKLDIVTKTPTSGDFTLNFSLDMRVISQLFTEIEKEVRLPSSSRRVTLNAYFESGPNLQVQSLILTLENNLIEIPNSLSLRQNMGSGQFDYKVNPTLTVAQTQNARYPSAVVDSLDFTFTFVPTTPASATISMQAILENPDIWQKKLMLVTPRSITGNVNLSYSFVLDQLQKQFDDIDEETGLTTTRRLVTIQVRVDSDEDFFVQNLPLTINKDVVEVGGTLQEQRAGGIGKFDYLVHLKPNSIFDTDTLEPPSAVETPVLPSFELMPKPEMTPLNSPSVLKAGQSAFIKLVDKMEVSFSYDIKTDKPVENLKTIAEIIATLEAPQAWSKSFILLHTEKSGGFNLNFPVDISGYTQLIESIRSETGVSPESYNLTVTANIHNTGETPFGPFNETFSPAMKGIIKDNVLQWNNDLNASATGGINLTTTVDNPNKFLGLPVSTAKILLVILSSFFVILTIGLVVAYMSYSKRDYSDLDREARKIQKKYGARIAKSISNVSSNNEKLVYLDSIEDLIKVADELDKPVVCQPTGPLGGLQSYFVIDGYTRYEYFPAKDRLEQQIRAKELDRTEEPPQGRSP